MDYLKHSICQQIWKTQQWPQDWKGSVFIPVPKKDNPKECSDYSTIAHISHASKKFSKPGFNSKWTVISQMFKLVLQKADEQEIKMPTSVESSEKQASSMKTSISVLLTMTKPLTVWITINCGKFWKRWDYQTTWPTSWEICMQVKKQQLELDMEQQPSYKSGKEYIKAVYNYPANLTSVQSTSCKMPGWMTHKLESRLSGEISIISDMQMIPP